VDATITIPPHVLDQLGKEVFMALHFWAAPAAARKAGSRDAAKRKPPNRLSIIVGIVIAVLAIVGLILLLTGQLRF
jgi:hypothetical protein